MAASPLRVLENHEAKRIGSTQYRPLDVRVIAATNRNLRIEVNEGRFRSDLFFRLAVLRVRMPSLRERPEDIGPLVNRILADLKAADLPQAAQLTSAEALGELASHPWP